MTDQNPTPSPEQVPDPRELDWAWKWLDGLIDTHDRRCGKKSGEEPCQSCDLFAGEVMGKAYRAIRAENEALRKEPEALKAALGEK